MKNYLIMFVFMTLANISFSEQTQSVAMIAVTRGEVTLTRGSQKGETIKLKSKDQLFIMDKIQTGERGRVQIIFTDGSIVRLGKKAEMTIEKYSYSKEAKKGNFLISIKEGSFRIMGGNITKFSPDNFKTETPTATIGVRGSMYAGKTNKTETEVIFLGGKGVFMKNKRGDSKMYNKPGESGWTRLGTPPTKTGKRVMFSGEVYLPKYIAQTPNSLDEPIISSLSDYSIASSITTVPRADVTGELDSDVKGKTDTLVDRQVELERLMIGQETAEEASLFTGHMKIFTDGMTVSPVGKFILKELATSDATFIDGEVKLNSDSTPTLLVGKDQWGDTGQGELNYLDRSTETPFLSWGLWTLTKDDFLNEVRISDTIKGYWVGGKRTPQVVVQNLASNQSFGYYYGTTSYTQDTVYNKIGNIDLELDFGSGEVIGSLYFQDESLPDTIHASLNSDGIKGTLGGVADSSIDGLFYGPNAEALGGTFYKNGENPYHGAFESKTSGEGDSNTLMN